MRPAIQFVSTWLLIAAWVVLMLWVASAHARQGEDLQPTPIDWTLTAGFDFSRGDYGLDEDTTLYYVPLGVSMDFRRFRIRLVVPLLRSEGPTQVATISQRSDSSVTQGLGQIEASAGYLFDPLRVDLPYVELTGKVTAPTETNDDLGTGRWATAIQADFFQRFGRVTPFLSVGRKFYEGDALRDRFYTSIGASLDVGPSASVGLAYDWLEATTSAARDAHEIVSYATFQLDERWSLGPYVVFGLSDGSPNHGFGISVSVRP